MDEAMNYADVLDVVDEMEQYMTARVRTTTGWEWTGQVDTIVDASIQINWKPEPEDRDVEAPGEHYIPNSVFVWHESQDADSIDDDSKVGVDRYWIDIRRELGEDEWGEDDFERAGYVEELEIVDSSTELPSES